MADNEWVSFGDVARRQIGEQAQYVSRYVDGRHGFPNLGQGVRIKGDPKDYHDLLIHRDDVDGFVQRVNAWRKERGVC